VRIPGYKPSVFTIFNWTGRGIQWKRWWVRPGTDWWHWWYFCLWTSRRRSRCGRVARYQWISGRHRRSCFIAPDQTCICTWRKHYSWYVSLHRPVIYSLILGIATRYIPPHLRNTQVDDGKDSEVTIRLTRQLKGLLNRYEILYMLLVEFTWSKLNSMSEQNMATVLESIEEVYRGHRRNGKWNPPLLTPLLNDPSHRLVSRRYINIDDIDHRRYIISFVVIGLLRCATRSVHLQPTQNSWYRIWYVISLFSMSFADSGIHTIQLLILSRTLYRRTNDITRRSKMERQLEMRIPIWPKPRRRPKEKNAQIWLFSFPNYITSRSSHVSLCSTSSVVS